MIMVAHDVNPILGYLDQVIYLAAAAPPPGPPREVITGDDPVAAVRDAGRGAVDLATGRLVVVGQPEEARHHTTGTTHERPDAPARGRSNPAHVEHGRRRPAAVPLPLHGQRLRAGTVVAVLAAVDRLVHGAAAADLRRPHPGRDRLPRRGRRRSARDRRQLRLLRLLPSRGALVIGGCRRRRPVGAAHRVGGDRHACRPSRWRCGLLFVALYGGFLAAPTPCCSAASSASPHARSLTLARHRRGRRSLILAVDRPAAAVRLRRPRRRRRPRGPGPGAVGRVPGAAGRRRGRRRQITGALLVFALLVVPAAAAQRLTARPAASLAAAVGHRRAGHLGGLASPTTPRTRSASG